MLARQVKLINTSAESCCNQIKDRQIVFHHIPKTAGSSLTSLLRTLFAEHEVAPAATDLELADLKRNNQLNRYNLFTGHYSYQSLIEHFPNATFLTFLRDPIERCISQYYNWHDENRIAKSWLKRAESDTQAKDAVSQTQNMTLEEFITSDNYFISDSAQNMMTRYLANKCEWEKTTDYYSKSLIEEAKHNLVHQFDFFGITEEFEKSKLMLAITLGIRPWKNTEALMTNVNPTKGAIRQKYNVTETQRKLLKSYNRMDSELYEFALNYFHSHYSKTMQKVASNLYELTIQAESPLTNQPQHWCTLDIKQGGNIRGFHYSEKANIGNNSSIAFRWTGLEPVSTVEIELPTNNSNFIHIEIDILASINPEHLSETKLKLNGSEAFKQTIVTRENGHLLRAVFWIPEIRKNWQIQTLSIVSPLEKEREGGRLLGLCIASIRAYNQLKITGTYSKLTGTACDSDPSP